MKFETDNEEIIEFYNNYLKLKEINEYLEFHHKNIKDYIENEDFLVFSERTDYYRLSWKKVYLSSQSMKQANKYIFEHIYDKEMIRTYLNIMRRVKVFICNHYGNYKCLVNAIGCLFENLYINDLDFGQWNYYNNNNKTNIKNEIKILKTVIKLMHNNKIKT